MTFCQGLECLLATGTLFEETFPAEEYYWIVLGDRTDGEPPLCAEAGSLERWLDLNA